jgi:hypothetical protein
MIGDHKVTNALKSQFNSMVGKRTQHVLQITPDELSEAAVKSKKRRINGTAEGPSVLSNAAQRQGVPNTHLIDSFRANWIGLDDVNSRDEYLPESQPKHNIALVATRFIKPCEKNKDAVGIYELAFLNTKTTDDKYLDILRLTSIGQECNPLNIVNLVELNHTILKQQLAFAREKGAQAYYEQKAEDYMKYFSLDGVPQVELTMSGDDSRDTSGFGAFLGKETQQRAGGYKTVTMIIRGATPVLNYGKGRTRNGAAWYLVCKKYRTIPDFRLTYKRNVAGLMSQEKGSSFDNENIHGIHPYLCSIVSVPNGGSPSLEDLRYEDELGYVHYDAFKMYIGTIILTPKDHVFKGSEVPTPFTDAFSTLEGYNSKTMLPTLVINANDGINTL